MWTALLRFTEKTEELTTLILEFGKDTSEINVKMNKFSDQAKKARETPSSGTPHYTQRIAKGFGEELSAYARKIEILNRKYGEVLPDVKSSLQRVLTFSNVETTQETDNGSEFLSTLNKAEHSVYEWKTSVVAVNDTISELPNYQTDMNRGIRRISQQFEALRSNLDDTLDMIQEARATYKARFQ